VNGGSRQNTGQITSAKYEMIDQRSGNSQIRVRSRE